MRYIIDHDLHIHSRLSSCSNDPEQSTQNLLRYAEENGYGYICLTDHFWSSEVNGASNWYAPQNYEHISKSLPLPQSDKVKFYFGCETDMDKSFRLGISANDLERLDFIIIPTTHMHMRGFTIDESDDSIERRRELYIERFHRLLDCDLPFNKIGIAHLTCNLIVPSGEKRNITVIDGIEDSVYIELFSRAAKLGAGIELNCGDIDYTAYTESELSSILRPYKIAKQQGCKFYLGSDGHHPARLKTALDRFKQIIDRLELQESDKFNPFGN